MEILSCFDTLTWRWRAIDSVVSDISVWSIDSGENDDNGILGPVLRHILVHIIEYT